MNSEIFGPILPIVPVKVACEVPHPDETPACLLALLCFLRSQDYEEAIAYTNAHDHPLAAYIFTDNAALKEKSTYV